MEMTSTELSELGAQIFGTAPPTSKEIETARKILASVSDGLSPLGVAEYLMNIPERNEDGEKYTQEWKQRSNPLICLFFSATNYPTDGLNDQVPWCAAFVNWCLKRTGADRTSSASSGSFRCYGNEAVPPRKGDIAVFKNPGQDKPCEGAGHVGFWLSQSQTHVEVLGGNQGNEIKVSQYSLVKSPIFISARRIP